MIINSPFGENIEAQTTELVSIITWNKDIVIGWAKSFAEKYVGLMVTEDNLKDMEEANKELAGKVRRLDDFRKQHKAQMEGPIKQFEAEVKEVIDVINSVKTPIAEQVRKFEDQRRCEQATEVSGWMQSAIKTAGLRAKFAAQLSINESWTNRTAVKSRVKAEIEARVASLMDLQNQEDQALEMARQRTEMAEMMCKLQSDAAGLAVAITPRDIYGIDKLQLTELPAAITAAIVKQQTAEKAAIERAERVKAEQEERKARAAAEAEAMRIKQAEIDAAKVAIAAVEAGNEYVEVEKRFMLDISILGTEFECEQFINIIDANGYNYVLGKMEEVK